MSDAAPGVISKLSCRSAMSGWCAALSLLDTTCRRIARPCISTTPDDTSRETDVLGQALRRPDRTQGTAVGGGRSRVFGAGPRVRTASGRIGTTDDSGSGQEPCRSFEAIRFACTRTIRTVRFSKQLRTPQPNAERCPADGGTEHRSSRMARPRSLPTGEIRPGRPWQSSRRAGTSATLPMDCSRGRHRTRYCRSSRNPTGPDPGLPGNCGTRGQTRFFAQAHS